MIKRKNGKINNQTKEKQNIEKARKKRETLVAFEKALEHPIKTNALETYLKEFKETNPQQKVRQYSKAKKETTTKEFRIQFAEKILEENGFTNPHADDIFTMEYMLEGHEIKYLGRGEFSSDDSYENLLKDNIRRMINAIKFKKVGK